MATKETLESELTKWAAEFRELGGSPDRLYGFLASRLLESGLVDDQDGWNVVRAVVGGLGAEARARRVRIVRWDGSTGHLYYESVNPGFVGFGMCRIGDIASEDHPKLAGILDRLEREAAHQPSVLRAVP